MFPHSRNIPNELIRGCAATGGVVGINGIGPFLGDNDNRPETVVRHIDYVAQLVGADHVGIGLDFVFDQQELLDYLTSMRETFPDNPEWREAPRMTPPEALPQTPACLGSAMGTRTLVIYSAATGAASPDRFGGIFRRCFRSATGSAPG